MNKILYLFLMAFITASCTQNKPLSVTITNSSDLDRTNELVELLVSDVVAKLRLKDTEEFVVLNENEQQVPYQLTYDEKVIFPATVLANKEAVYTIYKGTPEPVDTQSCGRQYPERLDDVAWENDCIAFRTYGPALQATGEPAYGYDVWVKSVSEPVVEARYAMELDSATLTEINRLSISSPDSAKALRQTTSYHVDHGNGLDCYKVGPTLGGGTAALMVNDTIVYPYCYKTFDVLNNGPLRFTVKLTYHPLTVKGVSDVVETRVITLDAGSQLNKTVVSYSNTNEMLNVATGIVLHDDNGGDYTISAEKGYMAYADPTDNVNNGNGTIYIGAVFPAVVKEAKAVLFSEKEKAARGGAAGHILAISDYEPASDYTYYWGAGWSKRGFENSIQWVHYLEDFSSKIKVPLTITLQ